MNQTGATWRALSPVLPGLLPGLGIMALLFRPEGAAAMRVWASSTAYGHCWLILPIACWLLWERRAVLRAVPARPVAWPVFAAVPLAVMWVAAALLGIMEGRQLAAMGLLLLLLLALLGWRLWWALSAGLLYLIFLVPFGSFLTPSLQAYTAWFVGVGLDVLNIPNEVTTLRIDIPEGSFYVAEACAGLRFLIASVAFGVLFAVTMFRSPRRRILFIAAACVVPIIANGFRGLGIVVLGHVLGSAQAAAADHIIYGWVFFSAVILLLALAGLPFQQAPSAPASPASGPVLQGRGAALACMPLLLVAASGPAVGWGLDHLALPARGAGSVWVAPPGCATPGPLPSTTTTVQDFTCRDGIIHTTTFVLPRRSNPASVVAAARAQAAADVADPDGSVLAVPGFAPGHWGLFMDQETGQAGAYVLWVDGAPALGGLHDRLHLARDLVAGSGWAPVAVTASVRAGGAAVLKTFIAGQGDLVGRLNAASAELDPAAAQQR